MPGRNRYALFFFSFPDAGGSGDTCRNGGGGLQRGSARIRATPPWASSPQCSSCGPSRWRSRSCAGRRIRAEERLISRVSGAAVLVPPTGDGAARRRFRGGGLRRRRRADGGPGGWAVGVRYWRRSGVVRAWVEREERGDRVWVRVRVRLS